jgi:hypothetical protein
MNVSDRDVDEAIGYLVDNGFVQELSGDMEYYVKILLVRAGESLNQRIEF